MPTDRLPRKGRYAIFPCPDRSCRPTGLPDHTAGPVHPTHRFPRFPGSRHCLVCACEDEFGKVVGLPGVVSEGCGDVGVAVASEESDGEVPEAGHHVGAVAGVRGVEVFSEHDITDPMDPVLDVPMMPDPVE